MESESGSPDERSWPATDGDPGPGREAIRLLIGDIVGWTVLGLILSTWLLWNRDNRQLWDFVAGTVVANDPDKRLLATHASLAPGSQSRWERPA